MEQTFSTGLIIGIFCSILFIGIVIYLYKNKGSKKQVTKPKDIQDSENKEGLSEIDIMAEHLPKKQNISAIDAVLIEPHMKRFASSIGALWQITQHGNENDMGKLAFDNLDLIIQAIASEDLKKEWITYTNDRSCWTDNLYMDKAASLIGVFKSVGVEILPDQQIVWDNDSHKRYRKYLKIEIGDKCEVLSPCAIYNGAIIDQGLVKKLN